MTELQLKNKFIEFIQESFYDNKEYNSKKFVIDNTNIHALKTCFDWANTNENNNKGIFLYGDYGLGKSSIIEGLYKFYKFLNFDSNKYDLVYRTAIQINTYFRDKDEYNISICKTCKLLFIPEIGREKKVFDTMPVEEILSERYDRKRPIIASCNEIKELPYGDYMYERIYHMCKVIEIRGESKR